MDIPIAQIRNESAQSNYVYRYTINKLIKSQSYSLIVKGFNSAGTGPPSQELITSTLAGDLPAAPQIIAHHAMSRTAVRLTWQYLGRSELEYLTGFTVYAKKKHPQEIPKRIPLPRLQRSYTVTGLQPGAQYVFYVTAMNSFGESDPSNEVSEVLNMEALGNHRYLSSLF